MDANWANLTRIGVFYDGHYFYKVNNYYNYEHSRKARISISGLHDFIRTEVSSVTGRDKRLCQIVDAHYFRGRFSAQKSDEMNKLFSERVFDDILMRENVVTHYLPLKNEKTGKPQEKGVDVWLALEAYELAIYKRFDVLVLVACDGDYVPLVRKLNTIGSQVMLLSWDFEYMDDFSNRRVTKTAQSLIEEVSYYVPMHEKIDSRTSSNDPMIGNLFVLPKKQTQPETPFAQVGEKTHLGFEVEEKVRFDHFDRFDLEASPDLEATTVYETPRESTIFSLKDGYGFIKDASVNNIFFHYSSLENADFYDLTEGMRVKYIQEKQDDNKYVALKVWIDEQV